MIDNIKSTVSNDSVQDGRQRKYRVRFRMGGSTINRYFFTSAEAKKVEALLLESMIMMGYSRKELEPIPQTRFDRIEVSQEDQEALRIKIQSSIDNEMMNAEFSYNDVYRRLNRTQCKQWMSCREQIATSQKDGAKTLWKLMEVQDEEAS